MEEKAGWARNPRTFVVSAERAFRHEAVRATFSTFHLERLTSGLLSESWSKTLWQVAAPYPA